ncbi:MAG: hypothetical protein ABIP13_06015 [Tepidiformaceae bacterium]
MSLLAIGLLGQGTISAAAAAAPVSQCNNDTASNVGGQGIACTVTIVNYLTSTGTLDPSSPSRVTVTRCVGAAGPIAAGGGTCNTTSFTSTEPVTLVQQCNGSGNGGGGVVKCSVTITNFFSGAPGGAITAATVYQCVGSVITGTGAPGTCTPSNTPGVNSVSAATVGQCNGSGNGGTSVGFVCIVTAGSTSSATLGVNVDQCNGSGNGGGALVTCTSSVSNQVVPSSTPTTTITAVPTTANPTPSGTPGQGTATPSATASPTGTAPTGTQPPVSATATRTATPSPAAPGTASPPPSGTPLAPRPPATGNAQTSAVGLPWLLVALLLAGTSGAMLLGGRLVLRRNPHR